MLRPPLSARIAYAAAAVATHTAYCNKSCDIVELLEKLCLRRKLRPALQSMGLQRNFTGRLTVQNSCRIQYAAATAVSAGLSFFLRTCPTKNLGCNGVSQKDHGV